MKVGAAVSGRECHGVEEAVMRIHDSEIAWMGGGTEIPLEGGVTAILGVNYSTHGDSTRRNGAFALRVQAPGGQGHAIHVIQVVCRVKYLAERKTFAKRSYDFLGLQRDYVEDVDNAAYTLDVGPKASDPYYDSHGVHLIGTDSLTIADFPRVQVPAGDPDTDSRHYHLAHAGDWTAFYAIDFCLVDGGLKCVVEWGRHRSHGEVLTGADGYWVECRRPWDHLIRIGRKALTSWQGRTRYNAGEAQHYIPDPVIKVERLRGG
jgi:hypothetical protein